MHARSTMAGRGDVPTRSPFLPPGRVVPALLAGVLPVAGCGDGATRDGEPGPRAVELRVLEPPAAAGSGEPNLAVGPEGRVYLTWIEPAREGDGHRLRFADLDARDGGAAPWSWSEPGTIAEGEGFFVNWADFPSLLPLADGGLAAHWLERNGPGTYAYGVRIAVSGDGGASWSDPIVPHDDGTETEHGFVSLFPDPAGGVGMAWLDGRDYARVAAASARAPADAEMSLRYARLAGDRSVRGRALVDGRVCDCCQTALALTDRGPLLVYRNRSEAEIRDIFASRLGPEGWSEPAPVHDDGWEIPACPVNGPSADARGSRAVVAWFTGAGDQPRVRAAFSRDAGETFGEPIPIDAGRPAGRVDVTLTPDGSAIVSWVEAHDDGADLRLRRVTPAGEAGAPAVAAATSSSRSAGFPRMALAGDRIVLAWTDPAAGGGRGRVRAGWLPLDAVPRP